MRLFFYFILSVLFDLFDSGNVFLRYGQNKSGMIFSQKPYRTSYVNIKMKYLICKSTLAFHSYPYPVASKIYKLIEFYKHFDAYFALKMSFCQKESKTMFHLFVLWRNAY